MNLLCLSIFTKLICTLIIKVYRISKESLRNYLYYSTLGIYLMNFVISLKNRIQLTFLPLLFLAFSGVSIAQVTAPSTGGAGAGGTGGSTTGTTATPTTVTPSTTTQNNPAGKNAIKGANTTNSPTGELSPDNKSKTDQDRKNSEFLEDSKEPTQLDEADQKKLALRKKVFGSSIFANKTYIPIPDQKIATPRDYTLGPDDALSIYLYGQAQLTFPEVIVNRDGFINLPQFGLVYVNGKTIDETKKLLIDKLSQRIPSLLGSGGRAGTNLMVSLVNVRSITVFVTGEVVNPASYTISSLHSAFNVLYEAGGPNEIGTFRDVKVIRKGQVISSMDLYELLMTGTTKGDIRLQDNDNIVVGVYKKRVEVIGKVKRPGLFELLPEEPIAKVLEFAGGFADDAYTGKIKVNRFTARERKILEVNDDQYSTFQLKNGDSFEVETILDRFENIVEISGSIIRKGNYALETSPTVLKLIENADGLAEDAFTGRANIVRTRKDLTVENIPFNLGDLLTGKAADIPLERLDLVVITSKFDLSESAFVHIQGEVNTPGLENGNFPFMNNMKLEDLILKAGGFKESAKTSKIEIVRRKKDINAQSADAVISENFEFPVSRDLTLRDADAEFSLQPYDEVIVRRSPNYEVQRFVTIEGEVLNQGPYGIKSKDEKISSILKRAGGLTDLAYPAGATLIRSTQLDDQQVKVQKNALEEIAGNIKDGEVEVDAVVDNKKEELININLAQILKSPGSYDDLLVRDGDIIRIPQRLETVFVQGELLYPTTVKFDRHMSFRDYISNAGGFTTQSMRRSAYVKYPNGSIDRTRKFLMFNIYPKVEPGSEIFVPTKTGKDLTTQQLLQQATVITSTLMTLILSVLAFRNIN